MAAIFQHSEAIRLDPKPGFVVKTRIVEGKGDHIYGTKVFINICHELRVPKPTMDFDPAKVFPMIVQNEWEIPIIVSLEKKASDKKGVPSFVYDCCINSECFQWVQVSPDLRMILVEWTLESVEMMHELVLEREYALPKMLCKGELSQTEITQEDLKNGLQKKLLELKQNETAGLIEELGIRKLDVDEEEKNEPLPDLTNIDGKRQRPLIQEIGEMSLDEVPNKELTSDKPHVVATLQKNTTQNSLKSELLPLKPKPHEKERYIFIITRELRGEQAYILFESKQLTNKVEISFDADNTIPQENIITIKNLDPTRFLELQNKLEIPVPRGYSPYRSFLLENSGQLYIFCEKFK